MTNIGIVKKNMAQSIYIKLGDPFYEQTFMSRFESIVVEKDGHRIVIAASRFIELITQEANRVWDETLKECKERENDKSEV